MFINPSNMTPAQIGRIEIITGPMFSGKCLGADTEILMYNGNVKFVQDIKRGEFIMGDDSTPREVISTSKGYGDLYLVKQSKGMSYVVNQEHILSLKNIYFGFGDESDVKDISVKDFLSEDTPEEIRQNYRGYRNSIEYPECIIPFNNTAYQEGVLWSGLIKIPKYIKINSLSKRKEWIVGNLETYGHINSSIYHLDVSKWEKDIIYDYINLIRSTGLVCKVIRTNTAEVFTKIVVYGNFFHTLPWKKSKNLILSPVVFDIQELFSEIEIECIGSGIYFGFTLDGNHRFMLKDGTVTHNTTELTRRLFCDASVNRKILYINHAIDTRAGSENGYSTHNPLLTKNEIGYLNVKMISCSELPTINEVEEYDTIGIDEAQFFENLDNAKIYADNGKRVVVSGLSGDFERNKFGSIIDLVPHAEDYTALHALCVKCADKKLVTKAPFTRKINTIETQIDVGADDKYIPVCRYHYIN